MLLLRSFEMAQERGDDTGALVARAMAAVGSAVPLWVHLEDSAHGKISAVARALKKHPALDALGPPLRGGTIRPLLASLPNRDTPEQFSVPLDHGVGLEVARGVPRSLPFNYSNFHLGPVPALWLAAGTPPPRTQLDSHFGRVAAEVVVASSWWTSGRQLSLQVHLGMTPPAPEVKKLPPLPEATQRLMDALGGSTHEVQELVADPDERAASAAAREAAGALAEAAAHPSAEQLAGVPFPHPELGDDEWHEQGEAFGSFKDELTEVCKPRGYRYQGRLGGRGIWVLTKRTKLHNQVAIKVDRGPIGGHAKAWLVLQGPLWSHTIHLPASRTTRELRVWNPATTRKLAGNFAAAADWLEREVVPQLEAIHGAGYAWYATGKV
ncbi:MAG: hypothetical protein IT370_29510 [Deltaproteobacteria bacterium]|nr:hypothetical protein [Deltaproteobacteria bacterium]